MGISRCSSKGTTSCWMWRCSRRSSRSLPPPGDVPPMTTVSPQRRREIIDALRKGTVPSVGLGLFAVGLDRYEPAIDDELAGVALGGAQFKAVRGEYGSGKTFF